MISSITHILRDKTKSKSILTSDLPKFYYTSTSGMLTFGAITTNSQDKPTGSSVFAGSGQPSNGKYYGLPYSCNSFGQTVYNNGSMVDACAFLYFDNGVKLFDPSSNLAYNSIKDLNYEEMQTKSSPSHNFKEYLKHIFLKVTSIFLPGDSFDYTAETSASAIPGVFTNKTNRTPETMFAAVYPKVPADKVQLTNAIGVPVNKKGDTYEVVSAGFYTLSFNTIVDLEQVPISELTIRIKEEKTNWNSDEGRIILKNVDPVPPETNSTHRIFRYLSPGDYKILIKAKDNWGFYSCVGLSGFSSDPVPINCSKCCVEDEFKDSMTINGNCDSCAN